MSKFFIRIAAVVMAAALALAGCDDLTRTMRPDPVLSTTPAVNPADASVAKTSETQKSVVFTLTSSVDGLWKVYDTFMEGLPLSTVTASYGVLNRRLTLTASEEDLAAGTYYVSVTEYGKTESGRLALTVGPYVAPGQSATPTVDPANANVAKTSESQGSVSFTLTSSVDGEWKVYDAQTGGEALTTVTVSFSAPALTLSSTGADIPAGTYYVSVTEDGETESHRLALTVGAYAPAVPTAAPTAAITSVAKTNETQKSVVFTLTSTVTGIWKVYAAQTGGEALANVAASFNSSTRKLTLTSSGNNLAAGTYYVSVTENGKTESGRLALAVTDPSDPEPPLETTSMIAAGIFSSYVLKSDGSLYAAGYNDYGRLGTGDTEDLDTFTEVASGVLSVSSWGDHALLLKRDGTVWVTGDNYYGQHGLGDRENYRTSFTQIPVTGVTAVSAGSFTSYFVKNDGTLWTVGGNTFGQQGTGGNVYTQSLVQVPGVSGVKAVSAGTWHCLILKTDGSVWAAGRNNYGQLGTGDLTDKNTFTRVIDAGGNPLSNVKAIAAGEEHSLILKNDGTIWGAGSNGEKALGLPPVPELYSTFTQIPVTNVKMIAAGHYHSLIATNNNEVWGVGWNGDGQLGTGDTNNCAEFTKVFDSGVVSMGGGKLHSILMKPDGTVWTTGYNYDGLLGLGDDTNRVVFTQATVFSPGKSTMPVVSFSFADKAGGTLPTATFTLTNSPVLSGTWKVYSSAAGTALASGVTASNSGSTLTLSHASDIPAGTYYAAFTENGKTESNRLALIVSADGIPGFLVLQNTSEYTITAVELAASTGGDYVLQSCPPIWSGYSYTFTLLSGVSYAIGVSYGGIYTTYSGPSYPVSAGNTTTVEFNNQLHFISK